MSGWNRRVFPLVAALMTAVIDGEISLLPAASAPRPAPSILRLSQRNEPADLDPATATLPDEFFIIRALSEGLVAPDGRNGPPRAAAAGRWEISADGTVYTFHLRAGATWSNGEAVTASDFIASYERVLKPATAATKADLFFAVKNARAYQAGQLADFSSVGFAAPDEHTLAITLERPTPFFLQQVASGPWLPVNPRVVAKFGRAWTRPENHVGNGAFYLVEWRPHQRLVVRQQPRSAATPPPHVDEIQFIAFDNGDAEERAYRAGQLDVTMAVPVPKLETYARDRPTELHHTPLAETHYLTFNTQRPPLQNASVRRALALAIDRAKIVERVLRGHQTPAGRLLPPTLRPGLTDAASVEELSFDPAEARRLLAAAGFPGGRGFPRLELSSWARPNVLEAIQAMWKQELGIDVAIALREAKVHQDSLRSGDYDVGFITSIPDFADAADVLPHFATGAAGNYPHWSDSKFDQLLEDAGRAANAATRTALFATAERRLLEATAIAPLYFNAKNWLMAPRVVSWKEDALWNRDYQDVRLDGK